MGRNDIRRKRIIGLIEPLAVHDRGGHEYGLLQFYGPVIEKQITGNKQDYGSCVYPNFSG
jgi:hypothetical protein